MFGVAKLFISVKLQRWSNVYINSFGPNAPFLYPLKTSKNLKVFCFQGVEEGCIGNKWVKKYRSSRQYSQPRNPASKTLPYQSQTFSQCYSVITTSTLALYISNIVFEWFTRQMVSLKELKLPLLNRKNFWGISD